MGLIGSAIGAAGSIFGGIKASKAMKKAKRNVEAQRQRIRTGTTGGTTRMPLSGLMHNVSLRKLKRV